MTTETAQPGQRLTKKRQVVSQRRASIARLVESGKLLHEIAADLGISEAVIRADLYILGIDISVVSTKQAILRQRDQKVERMNSEGHSVREIADELGINAGRVYYILNNRILPQEVPALVRKRLKVPRPTRRTE